jgi:hypothetical protein
VLHFRSSTEKAARLKASKEILLILQESEANQFEEIATGDKCSFRYSYLSSTLFARSPAEVIPKTRQTIGTKKTMMALFFTVMKPIVLDVLRKGHKCNQ